VKCEKAKVERRCQNRVYVAIGQGERLEKNNLFVDLLLKREMMV